MPNTPPPSAGGEAPVKITSAIDIDARPETVWSVLVDARRLPEWVPAVERVTTCESNEVLGARRTCQARIGRRRGTIVERCTAIEPQREIAYVVDDDTFGMCRMFEGYSFSLHLEPTGPHSTRVAIRTRYSPRRAVVRVLDAVVMRRRFRAVCRQLLDGLREVAETAETSRSSMNAL